MMTSDTRAASTPARSSAALIAVLPSSWAGNVANAPLNAPTGVRVALTMTTSSFMGISFRADGLFRMRNWPRLSLIYVIRTRRPLDKAQRGQAAIGGRIAGMPGRAAGVVTRGRHKKVAAPRETAYFDGNIAGPAS